MKKNWHLSENKKPFFGKELVVVNIGIKPFYEDLKKLNVKVAHVDWEPPAGGDEEVATLLDKIL
jgi:FdrA protein